MRRRVNGYLTVYIVLVTGILISLCLVSIQALRSRVIALKAEMVSQTAMDSCLAEYNRELFELYNILAIDTTYGTAYSGIGNLEHHLFNYANRNLTLNKMLYDSGIFSDPIGLHIDDASVSDIMYLTDGGGDVFLNQAVMAYKESNFIAAAEELAQMLKTVEEKEITPEELSEIKANAENEMSKVNGTTITKGKEVVTLFVDDPTVHVENIKNGYILDHVLPKDYTVSDTGINTSDLVSKRINDNSVNIGNSPYFAEETVSQKLLKQFAYTEYLFNYFSSYQNTKESHVVKYEIEYLLSGKASDKENLEAVAVKLLLLREGLNISYLLQCEEKMNAARILAGVAAGLLANPELEEALLALIIADWAYMESLYDVKCLFDAKRIPLLKNDEDWHYSLADMLLGIVDEGAGADSGLNYSEYLRIMLEMAGNETIMQRSMDVVEVGVRSTKGNKNFRLDACVVSLGTRFEFNSAYRFKHYVDKHAGY